MVYGRRRVRFNRRKPLPNVPGSKISGYRRLARKVMIPRGIRMKMHHFKQTYHPAVANFNLNANCTYTNTGTGAAGSGVLIGPSSASTGPAGYFTYHFTMDEIPQSATFAALFDAYRVNKIVLKFIPMTMFTQSSNTSANLAAQPQWLSTVIDYDDSTLLTTEGALLEYETFKQSRPSATHKRVFVPALAQDYFKTSGATIAYGQARKRWIDAAYLDVEHYGVKGLINGPANLGAQVQCSWKVYATAYISFKQTR